MGYGFIILCITGFSREFLTEGIYGVWGRDVEVIGTTDISEENNITYCKGNVVKNMF